MILTAGQMITDVIRFYANIASGQQYKNQATRDRARFYLNEIMQMTFNWAPHVFRHADATVAIDTTTGIGPCPSDFMSEGTQTKVLASATQPYPLWYLPEGQMKQKLAMFPTTGTNPSNYTWLPYTNAGVRQIQVWVIPSSAFNVLIKAYNKKCLDAIDFPAVPTVASGGVGVLTGAYMWRATFVWANGETEGGFESASFTAATNKATVTLPVPLDVSGITSVNFYRTTAGGNTYLLSGSVSVPSGIVWVSGVPSVQYSDNVGDTSLTTACPVPSAAYSGTEQFPSDFHTSVLFEGLKAKIMESQGDLRDAQFWQLYQRNVKRLWAETKPGQNVAYQMPAYGQGEWGWTFDRSRLRNL